MKRRPVFKEVTLRIRPPPHSWVIELLRYYPAKVEIFDCKAIAHDKVSEIFEVKCDPKHVKDVVERLKKSRYISHLEIFESDIKKGRIYGVLRTAHCSVCELFSKTSECFLGSAIYDIENRYVRWTMIVRMDLLEVMLKRLLANGLEVHVERISNIGREERSREELTLKQEQMLKLAWRLGFFDFPRKITLQKLSRLTGLSPATVAEVLRSGLKKLVSSYFKEKNVKKSSH